MRVFSEISLENITHNLNIIRNRAGADTQVMAVVKADAYGHGAAVVSRHLQAIGADRLAVSSIDEAAELRAAGITLPIMNLGYIEPQDTEKLLAYDVIQTVYDAELGKRLAAEALRLGGVLTVHFKLDTGMSRLGFGVTQPLTAAIIAAIAAMPSLNPEGIFTHFATSEIANDAFVTEQLERFGGVLAELEGMGLRFPICHASNSGGVLNVDDTRFNLVRPGIMLYGVAPADGLTDELLPAMSLRATLAQVHDFDHPVSVSYGRTFRSDGPIRTGTVTIGYADGLHRALSNRMEVLVGGKRARQIGNICMDMMVIDLTENPEARAGDVVTIFGTDGGAIISVEEQARLAGTISYELLCALSRRVERIYN